MQASQIPAKLPVPFANSGDKNTIPNTSLIGVTPGAASFPDGFPPLTSTAISSGGIPPTREDFNGAFYSLSAAIRWLQAGGLAVYDSSFSTAVGGYPNGAVLRRSDGLGFWVSTADNNTTDPDGGSPSNWTSIASVRSVFGRTGAVVAATGDYTVAQVTGAAPLASPALTGTPTINGSNALAVSSFTGANQSLGTSGYQKLPGGLILQWMSVTGTVGSTLLGTRSFPMTFPSAVYGVVSNLPTYGGAQAYVHHVVAASTSQYTINADTWDAGTGAGGTATMHIFALGI